MSRVVYFIKNYKNLKNLKNVKNIKEMTICHFPLKGMAFALFSERLRLGGSLCQI
jgi:hypothetical protein